jgi:hypothetical protein
MLDKTVFYTFRTWSRDGGDFRRGIINGIAMAARKEGWKSRQMAMPKRGELHSGTARILPARRPMV